MSDADRLRWDAQYADSVPARVELPTVFADHADEFPIAGWALDLACGQGGTAVWLARRGIQVLGVDISPVAIGRARQLAASNQVDDRCRFSVDDLDGGLPPGEPVDAIVCHRFRAPHLYPAMIERLAPRGMVAISVLSEVGASPGNYRASAGELTAAFADLDMIAEGEGDGVAWLIARISSTPRPPTVTPRASVWNWV